MEQEKYLPELMAEKDSLDPSFVHAIRLLSEEAGDTAEQPTSRDSGYEDSTSIQEIEKFESTEMKKEDEDKKYLDLISNKNIKLSERVLIPVKQYPKFNFVGKLLGPRGNSLKRLQEETFAKMSILGKGSMREKAKEEELRKSGEAKYAHLSDELHVLIEVFAPPGEAYSRMSHALEEVKKFLVPDYNDEIRQEQLRELSYLNGSDDSSRGRGIRGRGIRGLPAAPARGRGGAIPTLPPARGVATLRGTPVKRGNLPVPPVARGVPAPRARGALAAPGYRALPRLPALDAYDEYGYEDNGYGDEYEDETYDTYENSYATQTQRAHDYYEYEQGTSEEAYDSYEPGEWSAAPPTLKAPPPRSTRGNYRDHPYGRY